MQDFGSELNTVVDFILSTRNRSKALSVLRKKYGTRHRFGYSRTDNSVVEKYEELRSVARSILEDLKVRSAYSRKKKFYAQIDTDIPPELRYSETIKFLDDIQSGLLKLSNELTKKYRTSKSLFDRIMSVVKKKGTGNAINISHKLREKISEEAIVSAAALGVDMKGFLEDLELVEKSLEKLYEKSDRLHDYKSRLMYVYLYLVAITTLCKPLFASLTLLKAAHELELSARDKKSIINSLYDIIESAVKANKWLSEYFIETGLEYDVIIEALYRSISEIVETIYQIFKALTYEKEPDVILDSTDWCVDEATIALGSIIKLYEDNQEFFANFVRLPYVDIFRVDDFIKIFEEWREINKSLEHCVFA